VETKNFRTRSFSLVVLGLAALLAGNAPAQAVELIVNGDFEAGNSGFTSDYLFSPGNIFPEGTYDILTSPSLSHGLAAAYGDHTSGAGLMMAVNGSVTGGHTVWSQTVAVATGTDYDFSLWISAWFPAAPATLEFFFNGASIGSFGVSSTTGLWENFTDTWSSGAATSLTIAIVDNNTIASGNDFSLDDISLTPVAPPAVPEPSGLGLLVLGLGSLVLRRNRR
jgi:hypothetical protein